MAIILSHYVYPISRQYKAEQAQFHAIYLEFVVRICFHTILAFVAHVHVYIVRI